MRRYFRLCGWSAQGGVIMQMVQADGFRGLSLVVDLALDRLMAPAAILVALAIGGILGYELIALFGSAAGSPYQL